MEDIFITGLLTVLMVWVLWTFTVSVGEGDPFYPLERATQIIRVKE